MTGIQSQESGVEKFAPFALTVFCYIVATITLVKNNFLHVREGLLNMGLCDCNCERCI